VAKRAVDVVLLPSEEMMDRVIEANRQLLKRCADKIVLDKANCLPHISLAMGCIEETDTAHVEKILRTLSETCPLGPLTALGIRVEADSTGQEISVLEIKKTERLQSLHEAVMRKLAPYVSHDVRADMLLSPPTASESTLRWIRDYPAKSSLERFLPHITVGYGRINNLSFPIKFRTPQLALCHLGNHCTCRKILVSIAM
jgi:2'-5' RNA ligase